MSKTDTTFAALAEQRRVASEARRKHRIRFSHETASRGQYDRFIQTVLPGYTQRETTLTFNQRNKLLCNPECYPTTHLELLQQPCDLSLLRTVLDLGSGTKTVATYCSEAFPGVTVTSVDCDESHEPDLVADACDPSTLTPIGRGFDAAVLR